MGSSDLYLAHHGIKGMRWGVRRYQNPDGSYTAEGRKRYGYTISAKQEAEARKADYNKASNNRSDADKNLDVVTPEMMRASNRLSNANDAVSLAKIRDRVANEDPSKRSKARLADEKKYKAQGLSDEDAAVAAYNKEVTKKLLMVAGGVALAGATYAAYKHHDNNMDKFISDNVKLYRTSRNGSDTLHDGFYATTSKSDARKYVGLMTKQYDMDPVSRAMGVKNDWHQKTIKTVAGNVKIAGDKAGRAALGATLSSGDSQVKSGLRAAMIQAANSFARAGGYSQALRIERGIADLDKGKHDSKALYNAANMAFPYMQKDGSFQKAFFQTLKSRGYGGMVDVNDRSFSGYRSKNPVIIFDADKFKVDSNRKLGAVERNLDYGVEMGKYLGRYAAAGGAAYGAAKIAKTQRNAQRIRNYKREHPNTKMTDAQILDALDGD